MKKGRFSEEEIIGILKRDEAGQKVTDLAQEHGVSEATIYSWKSSKYCGLEVSEAQRLRQLEEENRRLNNTTAKPDQGNPGGLARLGLDPAPPSRERRLT